MSNELNPAGDPGKEPATTQAAAAQTNGAEPSSEIEALKKTVNSLSAALRRLQGGQGNKGNQPATPAKGTETQEATLKSRVESLEAERREIEGDRRNLAIRSAAAAAGVAEDRLDIFVDHVNAKHAARIKVDKRSVFAEDDLGQPQELNDFIGGLVDGMDFFKAPVQVPTSNALNNRSTRGAPSAPKTILDYTAVELADMQMKKPAEFKALVKASGL